MAGFFNRERDAMGNAHSNARAMQSARRAEAMLVAMHEHGAVGHGSSYGDREKGGDLFSPEHQKQFHSRKRKGHAQAMLATMLEQCSEHGDLYHRVAIVCVRMASLPHCIFDLRRVRPCHSTSENSLCHNA